MLCSKTENEPDNNTENIFYYSGITPRQQYKSIIYYSEILHPNHLFRSNFVSAPIKAVNKLSWERMALKGIIIQV